MLGTIDVRNTDLMFNSTCASFNLHCSATIYQRVMLWDDTSAESIYIDGNANSRGNNPEQM